MNVFLKDASETVLTQLKALGFEAHPQARRTKLVIGRIDASKLKQLSELAAVKYVAPSPVEMLLLIGPSVSRGRKGFRLRKWWRTVVVS